MEVVEHTAAANGGTLPQAEIDQLLSNAVTFAEAGMSAIR